jgi:hypothetical protein
VLGKLTAGGMPHNVTKHLPHDLCRGGSTKLQSDQLIWILKNSIFRLYFLLIYSLLNLIFVPSELSDYFRKNIYAIDNEKNYVKDFKI